MLSDSCCDFYNNSISLSDFKSWVEYYGGDYPIKYSSEIINFLKNTIELCEKEEISLIKLKEIAIRITQFYDSPPETVGTIEAFLNDLKNILA